MDLYVRITVRQLSMCPCILHRIIVGLQLYEASRSAVCNANERCRYFGEDRGLDSRRPLAKCT